MLGFWRLGINQCDNDGDRKSDVDAKVANQKRSYEKVRREGLSKNP